MIKVEVCYGTPEKQLLKTLKLPEGTTAIEAVSAANMLKDFPEAKLDTAKLGIFSRTIKPEHILKEGDRVEIYRPLTIDPMDKRRARAKKTKPS